MNLKQLIEKIKTTTETANDTLEGANHATRAMREGNKKRAIADLVDLKNDYRNALLPSASFLIVTGPHGNDLCSLTSKENGSFSVDAEEFYKKVADKIDSRAYLKQTLSSGLFHTISNALEEVAQENAIRSFPQLRFKGEYAKMIETKEQLVQSIKAAVNDAMGSEIVGVQAANSILEEALKREHSGPTLILLNTKDESLATSLTKDLKNLTKNVFLVTVGKTGKNAKNPPNSISIKEASEEALNQLLTAVKAKTV